MKKPELFLLFFTLLIGTVMVVFAVYHFIKPTTTDVNSQFSSLNITDNENITSEDGWIQKMNQIKSSHSYPVEIYRINF